MVQMQRYCREIEQVARWLEQCPVQLLQVWCRNLQVSRQVLQLLVVDQDDRHRHLVYPHYHSEHCRPSRGDVLDLQLQ